MAANYNFARTYKPEARTQRSGASEQYGFAKVGTSATDQRIRPASRPVRRIKNWLSRQMTQLGRGLESLRSLVLLWRTRSRQRSDLFRAPEKVRAELMARGVDVEREIQKRFWRP